MTACGGGAGLNVYRLLAVGALLAALASAAGPLDEEVQCAAVRTARDQCQFVKYHCTEESVGYIDYLRVYYCTSSTAAGIAFLVASGLWLLCLFMTIGIAASDFLCPNLNTMANMLGMSESLVGVTFLAFGNGSPDVFSTYAAMKIGSGSLAVGELIGAASFIVAVVSGAMALIRPFKVARKSFMRDILFFIVSITFAMIFVSDGSLQPWECAVMLALYVAYVLFVVWLHWHNSRRRRTYVSETRARDFYTEPGHERPIESDDEGLDDSEFAVGGPDFAALTGGGSTLGMYKHQLESDDTLRSGMEEELESEEQEAYSELTRFMRVHRRTGSSAAHHAQPHAAASPQSPRREDAPTSPAQHHFKHLSGLASPAPPIRPSLFSALEFRSLISKLEESKHAYPADGGIQLNDSRTTLPTAEETPASPAAPATPRGSIDISRAGQFDIPRLIITEYEQNGDVEHAFAALPSPVAPSRASMDHARRDSYSALDRQWSWRFPLTTVRSEHIMTLFPTMQGFRKKPWHGMVSSVLTAPSVLLLTLSVPVYETEMRSELEREQGIVKEIGDAAQIPKWLLILQCVLAPMLIAFFMYGPHRGWLIALPICLAISALLIVVLYFVVAPNSTPTLAVRAISFFGFVVAIAWVSAIANEVVGVLKLMGIVFDITDAILGVTVFAMGNSLGDLVANMTVAKMGYPMMALSACFGGPMLNILVGVGISCLIVLLRRGASGEGYHIDLSSSLIISGATLLMSLIFLAIAVPLNRWYMSRGIGLAMIVFWTISTMVNVLIEVVLQ
ncbi:hypothetical protein TRVA0_065S00474 [Trichomonascus vanleenenianus]|uniref:Ycx1p n=1 Tax=Trichomonascus vanleenenianus TaxID=2268995 RepID=UPI003ECAFC28